MITFLSACERQARQRENRFVCRVLVCLIICIVSRDVPKRKLFDSASNEYLTGAYSPCMQGMHCMPCQLSFNQKKLIIIFLKKYLKNFLDFNLRTFTVSEKH